MRNKKINYFDESNQKEPMIYLGGWTSKPRKIKKSFYIGIHFLLNDVLGFKKNVRPKLQCYFVKYNGRSCLLVFLDSKNKDGEKID